ncbi:MAG: TraR/DksA C4-type zinc finger protein [Rhodoglobus sp.]
MTPASNTTAAAGAAPALTRTQENKLRTRLEGDAEAAVAHIRDISAQMASFLESRRDTSTDDESDPEGPTLAFERAQEHSILQQAKSHSAEITAALGRIDGGTYGTCARCGSAIGFARLEARPSTPHCIRCAS